MFLPLLWLLVLFETCLARKMLEEPPCIPLRKLLGAFGSDTDVVAELNHPALKGNRRVATLLELLTAEEEIEDKATIFVPTGTRAQNTLYGIRDGSISLSNSLYRAFTVAEVLSQHVVPHGVTPVGLTSNSPGFGMETLVPYSMIIPTREQSTVYLETSEMEKRIKVKSLAKLRSCAGDVYPIEDVLLPHSVCSNPMQRCGDEISGPTCCMQPNGRPHECVKQEKKNTGSIFSHPYMGHEVGEKHPGYFYQCMPVEPKESRSSIEAAKEPEPLIGLSGFVLETASMAASQVKQEEPQHHAAIHAPQLDTTFTSYSTPSSTLNDQSTHEPVLSSKESKSVHMEDVAHHTVSQTTVSGAVQLDLLEENLSVELVVIDVWTREVAAADHGTTEDTFIAFRGIDYRPVQGKTPRKVPVEDLKGHYDAEKPVSLKECATLCSSVKGCNAASFFKDPIHEYHHDCHLLQVTFDKDSGHSPCKAPLDADLDEDIVLIFQLEGDECDIPKADKYVAKLQVQVDEVHEVAHEESEQDIFVAYHGLQYIPENHQNSKLLHFQGTNGELGTTKAATFTECASMCSVMENCTAALFFKDDIYDSHHNCHFMHAHFDEQLGTSPCKAPSDAEHDEDAVLMFRLDDHDCLDEVETMKQAVDENLFIDIAAGDFHTDF